MYSSSISSVAAFDCDSYDYCLNYIILFATSVLLEQYCCELGKDCIVLMVSSVGL